MTITQKTVPQMPICPAITRSSSDILAPGYVSAHRLINPMQKNSKQATSPKQANENVTVDKRFTLLMKLGCGAFGLGVSLVTTLYGIHGSLQVPGSLALLINLLAINMIVPIISSVTPIILHQNIQGVRFPNGKVEAHSTTEPVQPAKNPRKQLNMPHGCIELAVCLYKSDFDFRCLQKKDAVSKSGQVHCTFAMNRYLLRCCGWQMQ